MEPVEPVRVAFDLLSMGTGFYLVLYLTFWPVGAFLRYVKG